MFDEPIKVLGVLTSILELHPYSVSGVIVDSARSRSDAATLWRRLVSLEGTARDEAIQNLAVQELRLILFAASGRLSEADALGLLGRIFELHEGLEGGSVGWRAFLLTNGARSFARVAARYASGYPDRPLWGKLVDSEQPLGTAIQEYLRSGLVLKAWAAREDVALAEDGRLFKRLQRFALLEGDFRRDILSREGAKTVVSWLEEILIDSEQVEWLSSYITESHRGRWPLDDPFLSRVTHRFGKPDASVSFWAGLPEEVRVAVDLWVKDRDLTLLLGEGERVTFWRRFLPQMTGAHASRVGGVVFICFPEWFAVQFKEVGRATYMFPNTLLSGLRRIRDDVRLYNSVLENRASMLEKYDHRGFTWELAATAAVRRVLAMHRETAAQ